MNKNDKDLIENILALHSTDAAFEDFKQRMSALIGSETRAFKNFVTFASGCSFGKDALMCFATGLLLDGIQPDVSTQKIFQCYYACAQASYFAVMSFRSDVGKDAFTADMRAQLTAIVETGRYTEDGTR